MKITGPHCDTDRCWAFIFGMRPALERAYRKWLVMRVFLPNGDSFVCFSSSNGGDCGSSEPRRSRELLSSGTEGGRTSCLPVPSSWGHRESWGEATLLEPHRLQRHLNWNTAQCKEQGSTGLLWYLGWDLLCPEPEPFSTSTSPLRRGHRELHLLPPHVPA